MIPEYHNVCMRLSLHNCSTFVSKQNVDKNKDSVPMLDVDKMETWYLTEMFFFSCPDLKQRSVHNIISWIQDRCAG